MHLEVFSSLSSIHSLCINSLINACLSVCISLSLASLDSTLQANEKTTVEFFSNAQSWQCWHFCTTSNGNTLVIVPSLIIFDANVFFSNSKMPTLCITGKLH